jgi:hypothetical protein
MLVPVLMNVGFKTSSPVAIQPPLRVAAQQVFRAGAIAAQVFRTGPVAGQAR